MTIRDTWLHVTNLVTMNHDFMIIFRRKKLFWYLIFWDLFSTFLEVGRYLFHWQLAPPLFQWCSSMNPKTCVIWVAHLCAHVHCTSIILSIRWEGEGSQSSSPEKELTADIFCRRDISIQKYSTNLEMPICVGELVWFSLGFPAIWIYLQLCQ